MLTPIQTSYKGYRFRSRLEARWAVFFDALGLNWAYEPEGFKTPDGVQYLPDFKVTSPTGLAQWYEIKPAEVVSLKFNAFAKAMPDRHVRMLAADDPLAWLKSHPRGGMCPRCGALHPEFDTFQECSDGINIYCGPCDRDTPCGSMHQAQPGVLAETHHSKGFTIISPDNHRLACIRLLQAAVRTRSARFEHGESGVANGR